MTRHQCVARLQRLIHRASRSDRLHTPVDEVIRAYPGPKFYTVLSCSCGEVFYENIPKDLKQALDDASREVAP